jgi:PAS domain S-box-containing protein
VGRPAPAEGLAGTGTAAPEAGRFAAIISSLGEGVVVLDEGMRVEAVNAAAVAVLGEEAGALVGQDLDVLASRWNLRDRGPLAVSKLRHHLRRGQQYRNDDAFAVTRSGDLLHVSIEMTPLQRDGRPAGAVIRVRDVTAIRLAEQRLRESEQRFRRIFELAPTGMVRVASDGTLAGCNDAFRRMLGLEDDVLVGRPFEELWRNGDRAKYGGELSSLLAGQRATWQREVSFGHADGSTLVTTSSMVFVPAYGDVPPFATGVVVDETQRLRLELELRHAQKLEAVGRLAAGIAHELNTPIQFIGDNVHFLGEVCQGVTALASELVDGLDPVVQQELAYAAEEIPRAVRQTLDGVQRVSGIVGAMRTFGHPGEGERTLVDLEHAIETTVLVAGGELEGVATVEVEHGPVPPVPVWRDDLNQVLLNLLVNAAHAIAAAGGGPDRPGLIRVTTQLRDDGVEIAVEDTGTGIAPEIRSRLFEPFFTTKDVGRGTGQGLALARSIVVERHGGQLTFDTEVGVGTTFRVWLPLHPVTETGS